MSLQLTTSGCHPLPTGCPIVFDEILTKNSRAMCCHEDTGVIEVRRCGTYAIDWDVVVENSEKACICFSLEINGKITSSSTLPATSGQLTGSALIEVDTLPTTIRLINNTGCAVELSDFSPVAHLRIMTVK
ncbi:MAG: hypothetical protein FWE07_01000 [Turicibacter sp.]|nr:hypothetical protein [Turicibacter sp.]